MKENRFQETFIKQEDGSTELIMESIALIQFGIRALSKRIKLLESTINVIRKFALAYLFISLIQILLKIFS